ncbi:MAG: hypothetical protein ABI877_03315 [Gemmatimonadaceae bacterium]
MTAIAIAPGGSTALTGAKYFYVWMAALCMLVAFAGFAPTYWLPVSAGTFRGEPIFHIHGLLFSFWTVFFVAQTALAASGHVTRHRAVGLIGISLATSMVIVGLLAALVSLKHSIALGFGESAKAFAIVPVTGIPVFAGLFIAAIANVRRPDVHKRLMLVTTVSLLNAATGRLLRLALAPAAVLALQPLDSPPPPVALTVGAGIISDLIIVIGIIHDWRTRGRPHPAYLVGGGILLASQVLRVPLSATAGWHAIVDKFIALAG